MAVDKVSFLGFSFRCVCRTFAFFGSDNGGCTAAILTSFTMTCKRLHIDPFTYLRDVLDRISAHSANRLAELLPDQWMATRTAATTR